MYLQLPWSTAMRIWSNYLRPRVRLNLQRSYLMYMVQGCRRGSVCSSRRSRDSHRYVPFSTHFLRIWNRRTAKFQQYMYGGRPLGVRFNDRWHTFTPTVAKGGQAVPMQPDIMWMVYLLFSPFRLCMGYQPLCVVAGAHLVKLNGTKWQRKEYLPIVFVNHNSNMLLLLFALK